MPSSTFFGAALVLLSAAPTHLVSAAVCPPLGPVLPAPRFPSKSEAVKAAILSIEAEFDSEVKPRTNASAISIAAKSIHEDDYLLNYHITPSVLSGVGTDKIDENTIYRAGSISKIMPVLALLQNSKVSMDDPVTDYIPELRKLKGPGTVSSVSWDDITVGAVAAHLAGLATDCKPPSISNKLRVHSSDTPG